tara:strand:- start:24433 stop:25434 length:1002 start_codon:yes stop_codon:yes gene_type:complete
MTKKDLSTVLQEEEVNPFELIGIQAWILRSLSHDELKLFLRDFKKIVAKYHHPDKHINSPDAEKRSTYFVRVFSEIDELLEDEFYFRNSLSRFRDYNELGKLRAANEKLRENMQEARDFISNLEDDARNSEVLRSKLTEDFGIMREVENELSAMPNYRILNKKLKMNLEMVGYIGTDYTARAFDEILNSDLQGMELEDQGMQDLTKYAATHRPVGGKYKDGVFPTFAGRITDRKIIYKSTSYDITYEILGSITFTGLKILLGDADPSDLSVVHNNINRHIKSGPAADRHYNKIQPFLGQFLHPYIPFLTVDKNKRRRGGSMDEYHLFIPTKFT